MENFGHFCRFDDFGGQFRVNRKNSKVSTNTYRTKLSLYQVNSMDEPLDIRHDIGKFCKFCL